MPPPQEALRRHFVFVPGQRRPLQRVSRQQRLVLARHGVGSLGNSVWQRVTTCWVLVLLPALDRIWSDRMWCALYPHGKDTQDHKMVVIWETKTWWCLHTHERPFHKRFVWGGREGAFVCLFVRLLIVGYLSSCFFFCWIIFSLRFFFFLGFVGFGFCAFNGGSCGSTYCCTYCTYSERQKA